MSNELLPPVAWMTKRTLDGKKTLPMGESTTNAEYIKAHKEWAWDALYTQAAIDAAVAAERERCAKLCDQIQSKSKVWGTMAGYCAEQIRGQTP